MNFPTELKTLHEKTIHYLTDDVRIHLGSPCRMCTKVINIMFVCILLAAYFSYVQSKYANHMFICVFTVAHPSQ